MAPKLPKFLKKYLWDVDFENYDLKRYPREVILRILEMGDEKAVSWMKRTFATRQVIDVLEKRRGLSAKSAFFWSEVFGIPKGKILCLQPLYRKLKDELWPY